MKEITLTSKNERIARVVTFVEGFNYNNLQFRV